MWLRTADTGHRQDGELQCGTRDNIEFGHVKARRVCVLSKSQRTHCDMLSDDMKGSMEHKQSSGRGVKCDGFDGK